MSALAPSDRWFAVPLSYDSHGERRAEFDARPQLDRQAARASYFAWWPASRSSR
jgi:hypothetical protein